MADRDYWKICSVTVFTWTKDSSDLSLRAWSSTVLSLKSSNSKRVADGGKTIDRERKVVGRTQVNIRRLRLSWDILMAQPSWPRGYRRGISASVDLCCQVMFRPGKAKEAKKSYSRLANSTRALIYSNWKWLYCLVSPGGKMSMKLQRCARFLLLHRGIFLISVVI